MGFLVQLLIGYVTLPLYALVTQMDSSMRKVVFTERVAEGLKKYWHTVAKRQLVAKKSNSRGTPTTPEIFSPSLAVETSPSEGVESRATESELLPWSPSAEPDDAVVEIMEEGEAPPGSTAWERPPVECRAEVFPKEERVRAGAEEDDAGERAKGDKHRGPREAAFRCRLKLFCSGGFSKPSLLFF
ncbi:hypothetical protein H6P81_013580 [Aristolochia fimbriata]|uniref:Uncharacterized protein n=1 Tax=Aristolochia fimbriata TaxID=158543 RepID=A0AAV7EID4_ARIFI|nr:hypothetical protein H6P81_013580 [Aristolochia fimbriata]